MVRKDLLTWLIFGREQVERLVSDHTIVIQVGDGAWVTCSKCGAPWKYTVVRVACGGPMIYGTCGEHAWEPGHDGVMIQGIEAAAYNKRIIELERQAQAEAEVQAELPSENV